MAKLSFTGAGAPDKSNSHSSSSDLPVCIADGMVQHALVSPSIQVRILSIVDEYAYARLGDIIAELPDHPDPVRAVLVMVSLNILVLDVNRVLDENTIVRRCDPEPDLEDTINKPTPGAPGGTDVSTIGSAGGSGKRSALERLPVSPFAAQVVLGSGAERCAFARDEDLRQPGIYGLMSSSSIYIGMGGDGGGRVARGQQPIEGIDDIFVITDRNGNLTIEDARVAERILWSRVFASRERKVVNGVPDGMAIDLQRYSEIDVFIAEACLALRHAGVLFVEGSARSVVAGPRTEPGRIGPLRPLNDIPDGDILELCFGRGLVALAARQSEDHWVLLQGSDVRLEAVNSANASTRYLRAAWLHSGLLDASPDGRSFVVKRDLVFSSGSAVSQFVCGAKGRGLAGWQPIDPDGGYDPATPVMIAS